MVPLKLLGNDVTLEVPQCEFERTPEQVMHNAKKRWAAQGAERITVTPDRRNGETVWSGVKT